MKLDPQKTTAAIAGAYLAQIVTWAAGYFWHVQVPPEISTALAGLAMLVLAHTLYPTQAG